MTTLKKIGERICQSKYTKLYIALALLQGITVMALQSAILVQNNAQTFNIAGGLSDNYAKPTDADVRVNAALGRWIQIKWENIAIIAFQLWFVGMAFDATVYQNSAEVIVLAILNTICAFLTIIPVMDIQHWIDRFNHLHTEYGVIIDLNPLQITFYIEIVLAVVIVLYALIFNFVSYLVVKEFGWTIYKKIGPIVLVQRMYQIFQFFVLTLKIDIFLEFFMPCFHIAMFAAPVGLQWDGYIEIIVTIMALPTLYFGRTMAGGEHYGRMVLFISFQLLVIFSLILMLWKIATYQIQAWPTWTAFVTMGIVSAVATVVLGVRTMNNFGKGLGPYVRRGGQKQETMRRHELHELISVSSWHIDD